VPGVVMAHPVVSKAAMEVMKGERMAILVI
jgi:hypothetical protein